MRPGIIEHFSDEKGEGLIMCLRTGSLFYVHETMADRRIRDELRVGMPVLFKVETSNGGRYATDVECARQYILEGGAK